MKQILNVTITYPDDIPGLWDFFCGRVNRIAVHVAVIPVAKELIGKYYSDQVFQERFQVWLNRLWAEKDVAMNAMLSKQSSKHLF